MLPKWLDDRIAPHRLSSLIGTAFPVARGYRRHGTVSVTIAVPIERVRVMQEQNGEELSAAAGGESVVSHRIVERFPDGHRCVMEGRFADGSTCEVHGEERKLGRDASLVHQSFSHGVTTLTRKVYRRRGDRTRLSSTYWVLGRKDLPPEVTSAVQAALERERSVFEARAQDADE